MVEDRARAEERKEIIDVVEELILNWKEMFVVSRERGKGPYLGLNGIGTMSVEIPIWHQLDRSNQREAISSHSPYIF